MPALYRFRRAFMAEAKKLRIPYLVWKEGQNAD